MLASILSKLLASKKEEFDVNDNENNLSPIINYTPAAQDLTIGWIFLAIDVAIISLSIAMYFRRNGGKFDIRFFLLALFFPYCYAMNAFTVRKMVRETERSRVCLAVDKLTNLPVVLKRQSKADVARREFRNLEEISGCCSENMAQLYSHRLHDDDEIEYECDQEEQYPPSDHPQVLAMKYQGTTSNMKKYFDAEPRNDAYISKIIKPALASLFDLHARTNIVHCDIKPENFIRNENRCIIVDFDMACERNAIRRGYKGTPIFSPPESFKNRLAVQPSVDMWAIGIMIYQLAHSTIHPMCDNMQNISVQEFRPLLAEMRYREKFWKNTQALYAKDLCELLLAYDPAERVCARDAMRHPVFYRT